MASRRMFSMKIINSARFLKMPSSSQLLYFHLGLNADDDGVVEGYNILRMTGCSEDDLRVLVAKNFIIVLNEDLVSFVTDWNEHNLIRSDRKIDSIYKDLLLQIVPGVEMVTKTQRSDVKKLIGQSMDSEWSADGQTKAGIGKVSLGKERIDKERIDKDKEAFKDIFNFYIKLDIVKHKALTKAMEKAIDLAMKQNSYSVEDCKALLQKHKLVIEKTKNDGKFAVKKRPLVEFFGQKIANSTALICTQYELGGKYEKLIDDVKVNKPGYKPPTRRDM